MNENSEYVAAEKTITLRITNQNPGIVFNDLTKTFGDNAFDLQATAFEGAVFEYGIVDDPSNTAEVTLSGIYNQRVTILKSGRVKIKATLLETALGYPVTQIITLTILKATPIIQFSDLNKTIGDESFKLEAHSNSEAGAFFEIVSEATNTGAILMTGSNNEIVTMITAGQVLIKVTFPESTNFTYGEKTVFLYIKKKESQITFNDIVKVFGDDSFELNATAFSGAVFNYSIVPDESSTGTIALSGTHNQSVTILKAGVVTLKASLSENVNYYEGEKTIKLIIGKAGQSISFLSIEEKEINDFPLKLEASASSGLPVKFSVTEGFASVSENGILSIEGPGIVNVTASQDGNENFNPAIPVSQSVRINWPLSHTDQQVLVWPVPCNRSINIDGGSHQIIDIKLVNTLGIVVQFSISKGQLFTLDLTDYASGAYFLEITNELQEKTVKPIIIIR